MGTRHARGRGRVHRVIKFNNTVNRMEASTENRIIMRQPTAPPRGRIFTGTSAPPWGADVALCLLCPIADLVHDRPAFGRDRRNGVMGRRLDRLHGLLSRHAQVVGELRSGLLHVLRHRLQLLVEPICRLPDKLALLATRLDQRGRQPAAAERDQPGRQRLPCALRRAACGADLTVSTAVDAADDTVSAALDATDDTRSAVEIGRASCRERV